MVQKSLVRLHDRLELTCVGRTGRVHVVQQIVFVVVVPTAYPPGIAAITISVATDRSFSVVDGCGNNSIFTALLLVSATALHSSSAPKTSPKGIVVVAPTAYISCIAAVMILS